jgi:hypothetical protein
VREGEKHWRAIRATRIGVSLEAEYPEHPISFFFLRLQILHRVPVWGLNKGSGRPFCHHVGFGWERRPLHRKDPCSTVERVREVCVLRQGVVIPYVY